MKKVLIITYFFPPVGGMPVMRTLKFAKFLPANGWNPVVLTVKDADYYYQDIELVNKIPPEAKVYRTVSFEPAKLYRRISRLKVLKRGEPSEGVRLPEPRSSGIRGLLKVTANYIFIPDGYIGWLPFAVVRGWRLIRSEGIDIIYTTAPPFTTHLIGLFLKKLSGKPWVADFRDQWTERPLELWHRRPRKIEEAIEKAVLKAADRIIVVTELMSIEILRKFASIEPSKFTVITNGFDSDDFQGIKPKRETSKFTLTHTGTVWPPGTLKGFLNALNSLPPQVKQDTVIFLLGGLYEEDRRLIQELELSQLVETKPFVPHKESLSYQAGSDILLLFQPTSDATAHHAKTFEYLMAKRPILAMVPQNGAAAYLIRETGAGFVVEPDDIEGIKRKILELYERHKAGTLSVDNNSLASLHRFERRELTKQLARVFEEVSAK